MAKAGMIVTAILVAVVGIAAFAVHSYAADDPAMPQAGQMAPTFTLPSQDGTQISLDSFKGKWVVLYFYPKDMTTGCTIEAHNFQRDQEQYTKENAVILGVSVDSTDSHKQFCTKENLTFRLLSDPVKKRRQGVRFAGQLWRRRDRQAQHLPHRPERQDRQGLDRRKARRPQPGGSRRAGNGRIERDVSKYVKMAE